MSSKKERLLFSYLRTRKLTFYWKSLFSLLHRLSFRPLWAQNVKTKLFLTVIQERHTTAYCRLKLIFFFLAQMESNSKEGIMFINFTKNQIELLMDTKYSPLVDQEYALTWEAEMARAAVNNQFMCSGWAGKLSRTIYMMFIELFP